MTCSRRFSIVVLTLVAGVAPLAAQGTIAERTRGMQRIEGLIPLTIDDKQGKLFIEVRDSTRVLTFVLLATGLGSNPIGLDRAGGGDNYVTRFDRNGERVLVVFENWNYRSSLTANSPHQQTIAGSFPPSTVAALPIVAEEGGRLLVDATDFVVRDWNDIAGTLARANEGTYTLARDRSGISRQYTRAFPDNSEIDVSLTFAAQGRPGGTVSSIVPDGRAFTLRQHLSFVRLPDDRYRPRRFDPRAGFFGIEFKDFAQPIQNWLEQRWISRHRLQRANPADPNSPFEKPIIYYVDRGIPEPLRRATLEGARFWEEAFNRAGLRGGFLVRDLPEDADLMDARYNIVIWINRNERGWSFGGSLGDPRTGEMIKGMAHMDSHRARTDYNLYAGLLGAGAAAADTAFVLARVRQVTAHEIGHTLGMSHNYLASTFERGSVMDYPPPRVRLDANGNIDVTAAYASGPGAFDVWAIRWAYGIYPAATEADSLRSLIAEGLRSKWIFLSDQDARPEFASDPRVNLWDDAATATEFLTHQMNVRRVALSRFGERNLRQGEPLALLQERFAPLYLMHRFAFGATAKTIGGVEYHNAVRGDGQQSTRPLSGTQQRAALRMLLTAVTPRELAIPDTVLTLLGPRPYGYQPYVELLGSRTRPTFDELGAARTLSQMVLDAILQRDRLARLVQFAGHDPTTLSVWELLQTAEATLFPAAPASSARDRALQRVAQRAYIDRLIAVAADKDASPEVRGLLDHRLRTLTSSLGARSRAAARPEEAAHLNALLADIRRWLEKGEAPPSTPALRAPPGDPFGMIADDWRDAEPPPRRRP